MGVILYTSGYGGMIHTLSFSPATSTSLPTLALVATLPAGAAPTWLLHHPTLPIVYAVDEFAPGGQGRLSAYSIAPGGTGLDLVSQTTSGGDGPVHLVIKAGAKRMFVANYGGATMGSVELGEDGRFVDGEEGREVFTFEGKGPQEDRQEAPHPHGVFVDPTGQLLFCADLGTDRLEVWSITAGEKLHRLADIDVKKGSGPRHLIFDQKDERTFLYLIHELSNEISTFGVIYPTETDPNASLVLLQSPLSVLPTSESTTSGAPIGWTAAEFALTPRKSHLIVTNRSPDDPPPKDGSDVIVVYEVERDGTVRGESKKEFPVKGGRGLRHFALSPVKEGVEGMDEAGRWVAVSCEKTDEVVVFERLGGELREVTRVGGVKKPTVVVWG